MRVRVRVKVRVRVRVRVRASVRGRLGSGVVRVRSGFRLELGLG